MQQLVQVTNYCLFLSGSQASADTLDYSVKLDSDKCVLQTQFSKKLSRVVKITLPSCNPVLHLWIHRKKRLGFVLVSQPVPQVWAWESKAWKNGNTSTSAITDLSTACHLQNPLNVPTVSHILHHNSKVTTTSFFNKPTHCLDGWSLSMFLRPIWIKSLETLSNSWPYCWPALSSTLYYSPPEVPSSLRYPMNTAHRQAQTHRTDSSLSSTCVFPMISISMMS